MFFYISKQEKHNFPYNHKTKNFVISLDEGWTKCQIDDKIIWHKGYLDVGILSDCINDIINESSPTYSGNFCVIKVDKYGVSIYSDKTRSFPIWYNRLYGITNLTNIGQICWADSYISINNAMVLTYNTFDAIGDISAEPVTLEYVINAIDNKLQFKVSQFCSNQTVPLRVFLSGGADTTLLYSYIQKYSTNYELIKYNHTDHDFFYLKNHGTLKDYWGYQQIHHWIEPCVLASGAPGDEFTLRNPRTADILLRYHGTSFIEIMNDPGLINSLNYQTFLKYYNNWNPIKCSTGTLIDSIKECCNIHLNDWQHWHIGNTLTWTPFRDLEILKLIARLSLDDLKDQLMNSKIQLELIQRNNPNLLTYMSTNKNFSNYLENLTNLYYPILTSKT